MNDSIGGGQPYAYPLTQSKPSKVPAIRIPNCPTNSGRQPRDLPFIALKGINEAVVESIRPALPELEMLGDQAISTPVRGPGDLAFGMLGLKVGQARLEDGPVSEDIALIGRQGAQLATLGAPGEIGHGLFVGSLYQ